MPATYVLLSESMQQRLADENAISEELMPVEAEVEFDICFAGQYIPASKTDPESLADVRITITSVHFTNGEFSWKSIEQLLVDKVNEVVYNDYIEYFNRYSLDTETL